LQEKPELESHYRNGVAEIDAFAEKTRNLALDPVLGEAQT
jgi:hypothetical protein